MKLGRAIVLSFASLGAILFVLKDHTLFQGFPRSIIFVSGAMALFLTGTLRFAKRIYIHGFKNKSKDKRENKNKILIIGAGDAGEKLARHIIASPNIPYSLEGFIDDNSMKQAY